jgi:hypothetical protein
MSRAIAVFCVGAVLLAPSLAAAEPVVSLWYRGSPTGQPSLDDLAAIRARGFSSITWPSDFYNQLSSVRRMAAVVGLRVDASDDVNGPVASRQPEAMLPAIAWRALAAGDQVIRLDSGSGATLADVLGSEWARIAVGLSRQITANAAVLGALRPEPGLTFNRGRTSWVEVRLFSTSRSWIIVATNTGEQSADIAVRLPPVIPYAIWVSLIDGSTMGMLDDRAGPRWESNIGAGAALAYVIDRPR